MYTTTKELKWKEFRIINQDIEQAIGILARFNSEINLQKETFLAKYDCFSADLCAHFETLLGWECTYICHNIRLKKKLFTVYNHNIKQETGIQVALIMEKKLHKKNIYQQKSTVISVTFGFILNPCQDGNLHTYATTKELKSKEFTLHNENIKQEIGIHLSFILEIKFQKQHFLAKYQQFFKY